MINDAFKRGCADALARFKLGNLMRGAAGYNPMLTGQAATGAPPSTTAPPTSPAPPVASGAPKANVLG